MIRGLGILVFLSSFSLYAQHNDPLSKLKRLGAAFTRIFSYSEDTFKPGNVFLSKDKEQHIEILDPKTLLEECDSEDFSLLEKPNATAVPVRVRSLPVNQKTPGVCRWMEKSTLAVSATAIYPAEKIETPIYRHDGSTVEAEKLKGLYVEVLDKPVQSAKTKKNYHHLRLYNQDGSRFQSDKWYATNFNGQERNYLPTERDKAITEDQRFKYFDPQKIVRPPVPPLADLQALMDTMAREISISESTELLSALSRGGPQAMREKFNKLSRNKRPGEEGPNRLCWRYVALALHMHYNLPAPYLPERGANWASNAWEVFSKINYPGTEIPMFQYLPVSPKYRYKSASDLNEVKASGSRGPRGHGVLQKYTDFERFTQSKEALQMGKDKLPLKSGDILIWDNKSTPGHIEEGFWDEEENMWTFYSDYPASKTAFRAGGRQTNTLDHVIRLNVLPEF